MATTLTAAEKKRLATLEDLVDRSRESQRLAADALAEIRETGLFREAATTFTRYVRLRFDRSYNWAFDILRHRDVVLSLGGSTAVDAGDLSQRCARFLAPLPVAKRLKVVEIARKLDPLGPLTEDLLRRSRTKLREPKGRPCSDVEFVLGRFQDVEPPLGQAALALLDPPYGRDFLDQWEPLSAWCAKALKPGGRALFYSPVAYLPEVMQALGRHLTYSWTVCRSQRDVGGFPAQLQGRTKWTPILCYGLPILRSGKQIVPPLQIMDVISAGGRGRLHHRWEKPCDELSVLISALTKPGDLVVDATAGSASTLLAAAALGRRGFGVEADVESHKIGCKRLGLPVRKKRRAA